MLHKYKIDSKRTCKLIKGITGKQKAKSDLLPQEHKVDKTIVQNPQDIAKELYKFITSGRSKLLKKIPKTVKQFQYFFTSHNEKIQLEELNFNEFEDAYKSLKRNKAAGFDDLNSNIITDTYDSLKNTLFHVFRVSIQ